jgi:hypothetical protein
LSRIRQQGQVFSFCGSRFVEGTLKKIDKHARATRAKTSELKLLGKLKKLVGTNPNKKLKVTVEIREKLDK